MLRRVLRLLLESLWDARIVRARDAADSGERIELHDLVVGCGFDPVMFGLARSGSQTKALGG